MGLSFLGKFPFIVQVAFYNICYVWEGFHFNLQC
jgi:hypothetical protein